jgi:hypothetical protein
MDAAKLISRCRNEASSASEGKRSDHGMDDSEDQEIMKFFVAF